MHTILKTDNHPEGMLILKRTGFGIQLPNFEHKESDAK